MKRTRAFASQSLTLVVLIGLGIVVFHRSGAVQPFRANAPGSARPAMNQAAKTTRPFCVAGPAIVDPQWSTEPDGAVVLPSNTSQSGALDESRARVLSIDGRSTDLGEFQGIMQEARFASDHRIAALTLDGGDGNKIRLIMRLEADSVRKGWRGTYRILGGEGKFSLATGEGSYRDEPTAPKNAKTVTVFLEGTICF